MKAIIVKIEDYDTLPYSLCDAIWEIAHKKYGFRMISRETKREIDKDTMVGFLIGIFKTQLEAIGNDDK